MADKQINKITKIEKRAIAGFAITFFLVLFALGVMVYINTTSWKNSDIMVLFFLIVFFCGIISVIKFFELISLARTKKKMRRFEAQNENFSKLYYGKSSKADKTTIFDIIFLIENEKPTKGFDGFGWYFYFIDKAVSKDSGFITEPTYIRIRPSFYSNRYGIYPEGAVTLDFIFIYPHSRNLLVYYENRHTFGIYHNWGGEEIKQDNDLVKILEEY